MTQGDLAFWATRFAVGAATGAAVGYCHAKGQNLNPEIIEKGLLFGPAILYGGIGTYQGMKEFPIFPYPLMAGSLEAIAAGAGTFVGYYIGKTLG